MLELRGLAFGYGQELLLREIALTLRPGERLGLLGKNGSGKTTLLRLIRRQLIPRAGQIWIAGQPLGELSPRALALQIACLPQFFSPHFPFTVEEIVAMGRHPHLTFFGGFRREDRERIGAALEKTELTALAGRRITALSGGERQRVLIARALCQEAPLLLFDEPSTHLDLEQKARLARLLRSLTGTSQLLVSHDIPFLRACCDRVGILHGGSIARLAPAAEVLSEAVIRDLFGGFGEGLT